MISIMRCIAVAVLLVAGSALAQPIRAPFHVSYDLEHLDLAGHVLQFKPSRAVTSAELVAIGEDGSQLGTGSATYDKPAAGTWLSVSWTQPADARVLMLKLRVVADNGLATHLELTPWSVSIDHEDVSFATNSSAIEPGEEAKLEASLARIGEVVKRSE